MTGLREEKKNKIRNTILTVSRESFLENGYDNTSTKDIAKRAGIGAGTVFNYFPTKADILMEIICSDLEKSEKKAFLDISKSDVAEEVLYNNIIRQLNPFMAFPPKIIKEFAVASLSLFKNKSQVIQKLVDVDMNLMNKITTLIIELQDKGLIDVNKDSKSLSKAIFSSLFLDTMLYVFDDRIKKEDVHQNLKDSIAFLIK